MKKIEIIVDTLDISNLKYKLQTYKLFELIITQIQASNEENNRLTFQTNPREHWLTPKYKVEVMISDRNSEHFIRDIVEYMHTSSLADGKMFVYDVAEFVCLKHTQHQKAK